MTGSFLFVKPSDPEGKIGTAYSDDKSPRYPYDHASWEWLLERAIRRTLIPWALTKSHSRDILSGHEDKYSMHRWGSYGVSYGAGVTPTAYQSVGGLGSTGRKTDSDLSSDDRTAKLPVSWSSSTGAPTNSEGTKVKYGIVDLEVEVAYLPFSLEWLHPDWSSSELDAWDLTAFTTETTKGSATTGPNGLIAWTWDTTVEHSPYDIPDGIPFKCLSHMRTDDDLVTVGITNDDDETITVETAHTPAHAPRTTDAGGSIRYFNGSQIRSAEDGAAYGFGWKSSGLSEFSIPYRYGLDYSPSTSPVAYGRDGKTSSDSDVDEDESTLGYLVDVPDMAKYIAVSYGSVKARFIRDIGWGDDNKKQTYWHAKDFPKGLDSVLSPKLKDQLKALCPVCQPAIPPAVPAFWDKFPAAGHLPWDNPYASIGFLALFYTNIYPSDWMQHLALACTPLDMSARLDAMTTTVHRVPVLFAKIKTVMTEYSTSRTDSENNGSTSWEETTVRKVVTEEGTSSSPIPTNTLMAVSGYGSGVNTEQGTETHPTWTESWSTNTQYTWEEGFKSNSDFIVCLRSTANTTLSTKVTTKTTETHESSSGSNPSSPDTETSVGYLPDSYDPDPDDLLFPDWVLPWIDTAELFASIESRLGRTNHPDYTFTYDIGVGSYSGSGGGSHTHEARRKIVSLGKMNTSTGRFPALDAAAVLSKVDPGSNEPTGWDKWGSYDVTKNENIDADGNHTGTQITVAKGAAGNKRSRSVSYYVVVKWKFDRPNPETLATG